MTDTAVKTKCGTCNRYKVKMFHETNDLKRAIHRLELSQTPFKITRWTEEVNRCRDSITECHRWHQKHLAEDHKDA